MGKADVKWSGSGGRYEFEGATMKKITSANPRALITFTGNESDRTCVQLVRLAADKLRVLISISTEPGKKFVARMQKLFRLGPEIKGEMYVIAIPAKDPD